MEGVVSLLSRDMMDEGLGLLIDAKAARDEALRANRFDDDRRAVVNTGEMSIARRITSFCF